MKIAVERHWWKKRWVQKCKYTKKTFWLNFFFWGGTADMLCRYFVSVLSKAIVSLSNVCIVSDKSTLKHLSLNSYVTGGFWPQRQNTQCDACSMFKIAMMLPEQTALYFHHLALPNFLTVCLKSCSSAFLNVNDVQQNKFSKFCQQEFLTHKNLAQY